MQDVPLEQMEDFRTGLLAHVEENAPDVCRGVDMAGLLSQSDREEIVELARGYLAQFSPGGKQGG